MELDIRQVAENLVLSLVEKSERLVHQAEGVRLFYQTLVKEGEKLNSTNEPDTPENNVPPIQERAEAETLP